MSNDILFIDTSAFVALNDSKNPQYQGAVELVRGLMGQTVKLVTSFLVVAEAATELREGVSHDKAEEFLEFFQKQGVDVLSDNETIRHRAVELFEKQKDTDQLSLFDCLKVAIMHYYGINKIFTFDEEMDPFNIIRVPK